MLSKDAMESPIDLIIMPYTNYNIQFALFWSNYLQQFPLFVSQGYKTNFVQDLLKLAPSPVKLYVSHDLLKQKTLSWI